MVVLQTSLDMALRCGILINVRPKQWSQYSYMLVNILLGVV